MENFTFQNAVKILFGKGQIEGISNEIPKDSKVLVTFGGGSVEQNGTLDQVRKALSGHNATYMGGIEPNPSYETLMKFVKRARDEKIDYLLAVGGGSVIDGTKFIAAALPFEGEPWDILAKQAEVITALPIGCVLTLPATGSETNPAAVISRQETNDKLAFISELVRPLFAVLDPTVTYSLPPRQIANGICDAFVHVMEQYMTYPNQSHLQDRFAEGILQTLIEDGPITLTKPENYDARASLMWCATMALNNLIGQGVAQDWSSHMIGHELTALYGLDHAQSLAIVLPANLQVCCDVKRDKLIQYGRRVWKLEDEDEEKLIDLAIQKTADFFESLGLPTSFAGYEIECDSAEIISQLKRHGLTTLGERGQVTLDTVQEILKRAA